MFHFFQQLTVAAAANESPGCQMPGRQVVKNREEWSAETVTRWHWGTVDWHGTLQGNNMNVRWFLCVRICNTFSSYDPNLD